VAAVIIGNAVVVPEDGKGLMLGLKYVGVVAAANIEGGSMGGS